MQERVASHLGSTKLERLIFVNCVWRIHDLCQRKNNAKLNLTCEEAGNIGSFIHIFLIVFCSIYILLVLKFKFSKFS